MPGMRESYPAIVTNIADPLKRGRVKVKCAGLIGDDETELPQWIEPHMDWGWFIVPDVDEEIEIEAVVSDETEESIAGQAFLEEADLRWRGTRFGSAQGDAPRPPPSDLTATNYGKRRGFGTPTGHLLMFDDTAGSEEVRLSWKRGEAEDYCFLVFDKAGSVILSNAPGSMLYMNADGEALSLIDQHGNTIASDAKGIKLISKQGHILEMKDGAVQVISAGGLALLGNALAVATATVDLAAPSTGAPPLIDFLVKGTTWAAARATLNTTMQTQFTALAGASTGLLAALAPGFTAIAAALGAFEAGAATYLSTKVKTG